jgi:uncharacterized protein YecT (DUF1311 family)
MSLFDRRFLTLAVGALAIVSVVARAQTQAAMNQDACAQYKKADQALNATYAKVLKDYAKDPLFLTKLKQAQRAWIVFREAHLAALSESRQAGRVRIRLSHLPLRCAH